MSDLFEARSGAGRRGASAVFSGFSVAGGGAGGLAAWEQGRSLLGAEAPVLRLIVWIELEQGLGPGPA